MQNCARRKFIPIFELICGKVKYVNKTKIFFDSYSSLQKEVIQVSLILIWHINNSLYVRNWCKHICNLCKKKYVQFHQLFGSTGREKSCSLHLMGPNCQIVPISTHYQKGNTLEDENWMIISALSKYKLSVWIKAGGGHSNFGIANIHYMPLTATPSKSQLSQI